MAVVDRRWRRDVTDRWHNTRRQVVVASGRQARAGYQRAERYGRTSPKWRYVTVQLL